MSQALAATEPFGAADELTCYYDRPSEPANVHLEARLPPGLDQDGLRAAVNSLLRSERGLLTRRASPSRWQRRFRWEFASGPDGDPVQVSRYADGADLDRQRDAFVSVPPPLDTAPPFLIRLATGPGGDYLLLNAHHARFDGLACLRLLTALADAYGRETGSGLARTGAAERAAVQPLPGASGPVSERVRASRAQRLAGPVTRIAPGPGLGGSRERPGYGLQQLTWEGPELAAAARGAGASVNDMLITALMLTIADWNATRHAYCGPGQIRITMPVGERRQSGADGAWANRSRLASVAARAGAGADPAALLAEVASQTRLIKQRQGPQVDALSRALVAAPVPAGAKHAMLRAALRVAGPRLCDTALLSNLGPAEPPCFGELTATELWFSTSAHLPRGLSLGAVTCGGQLRLTFRYRRALLSPADAEDFATRYGKALEQIASAKAVGL